MSSSAAARCTGSGGRPIVVDAALRDDRIAALGDLAATRARQMLGSLSALSAATAETIDLSARPLTAWEFYDKAKALDPATAWRIEDGVLRCAGEPRG